MSIFSLNGIKIVSNSRFFIFQPNVEYNVANIIRNIFVFKSASIKNFFPLKDHVAFL